MQATITLVDRQKWAQRSFFGDIVALGVMLIANAFLATDLYIAGRALSSMLESGSSGETEALLIRIALEAVLLVAAYAWVAFRVVSAGYRRATRLKE